MLGNVFQRLATGWLQGNEYLLHVQILKKELTAPGYTYDAGLRDQNAIVYELKASWEEHQSHVLLVNKQYCLNCYWKDLMQGDLKSDETKACSCCPLCTCFPIRQELMSVSVGRHSLTSDDLCLSPPDDCQSSTQIKYKSA